MIGKFVSVVKFVYTSLRNEKDLLKLSEEMSQYNGCGVLLRKGSVTSKGSDLEFTVEGVQGGEGSESYFSGGFHKKGERVLQYTLSDDYRMSIEDIYDNGAYGSQSYRFDADSIERIYVGEEDGYPMYTLDFKDGMDYQFVIYPDVDYIEFDRM